MMPPHEPVAAVEQVPAYRWRCPSCRKVGELNIGAVAAAAEAAVHVCDPAAFSLAPPAEESAPETS